MLYLPFFFLEPFPFFFLKRKDAFGYCRWQAPRRRTYLLRSIPFPVRTIGPLSLSPGVHAPYDFTTSLSLLRSVADEFNEQGFTPFLKLPSPPFLPPRQFLLRVFKKPSFCEKTPSLPILVCESVKEYDQKTPFPLLGFMGGD